MPRFPPFPPDPNELNRRLFRIVKPPKTPTPWMIERWREEADARRQALGLPSPIPRGPRKVVHTGSKMIWPWRLTWSESPRGSGQIKVLKEERTIGVTSFESRAERLRLVTLLESILTGGK